jgi:hypothetical protein
MRPRLLRALAGVGLGGGLVLIWWGLFRLSPRWPLRLVGDDTCRSDLGCGLGAAIVSLIITVAVVLAISMAAGWLLLWAVRVRPAWPVALVGPILGWVVWWLANPVLQHVFGDTTWRAVVAFAVGYGLAGLITPQRSS